MVDDDERNDSPKASGRDPRLDNVPLACKSRSSLSFALIAGRVSRTNFRQALNAFRLCSKKGYNWKT